MSFTSQNYGVRKFKRMDKVLIDCIIISMVTALTLGCSAYFFGPELLKIYTKDTDGNTMWNGNSFLYHSTVFPLRNHGSVSGSFTWNGTFRCSNDLVCNRNCWNQNCVDFWNLSTSQITGNSVYFLSGILDIDDHYAGDLLLFCKKKST